MTTDSSTHSTSATPRAATSDDASTLGRAFLPVVLPLWLLVAVTGSAVLWSYDVAPGMVSILLYSQAKETR